MMYRIYFILLFSSLCCCLTAQNNCFCFDSESMKEASLNISNTKQITDSFKIVSIVPLDKKCCLFINSRMEQKGHDNVKKFLKLYRKNNKCWVVANKRSQLKNIQAYLIHIQKEDSIYVIVSQLKEKNFEQKKLQINKSYLLTIVPHGWNMYPKHGIRGDVEFKGVKYILDSGYLWFSNIYLTEDVNGIYYTPHTNR